MLNPWGGGRASVPVRQNALQNALLASYPLIVLDSSRILNAHCLDTLQSDMCADI